MIVGAGLTGLIAAHAFPAEQVMEKRAAPEQLHKALLRFRTTKVADLTGIEFRPVTVHKGIWHEGAFRQPDVQLANLYSQKVIGALHPRSIWNLSPATRYIAPEDFYARLIANLRGRVSWGSAVTSEDMGKADVAITTAPMPFAASMVDEHPKFEFAPITVKRFRVDSCDVHQTVYFPSAKHSLYRASITGSLLVCEFRPSPLGQWWDDVTAAFALDGRTSVVPLDDQTQRFGKIAPIQETQRQRIIAKLTDDHGVYSLGRFATWRNILLDDVVHDCAVIKRLLTSCAYQKRLIRS